MIYLAERRQKRETNEPIELDSEGLGFVLEPTHVELGSGYTVSVNYDENETPIINVKTYGEVDVEKLRREIERAFPRAQIRQINPTKTITVVRKRKRKK
jgi:hypothetical protein